MSRSPLVAHPDGVLVRVWTVTGASTTEMKGWHDGRLEVRVAAPPEAGRANDQVTRVLADRLGVPVELASGTSARDKVFLARHIEVEEVWGKLSR